MIVKKYFGTGLTSITLLLVSLFELLFVTMYFPLNEYGVYVKYNLIITLLALFGNGSINQYYLRRNYKFKPKLDLFIIIVSLVQSGVFVLCYYFNIVNFGHVWLFIPTFFLIYFNIQVSKYDSTNLRECNIPKSNLGYLISGIIHLTLIIFISFLYPETRDADFLIFLVSIKSAICCIVISDFKVFKFELERKSVSYGFKSLLYYLPFSKAAFFNYSVTSADKWFVSYFFGNEILGIYARCFQLVSVPITFFNRILSKDVQASMILGEDNKKLILNFMQASIFSMLCMALFVMLVDFPDNFSFINEYIIYFLLLIPVRVFTKYIDVHIRANSEPKLYYKFFLYQFSVMSISLVFLLMINELIPFQYIILWKCFYLVIPSLVFYKFRVKA